MKILIVSNLYLPYYQGGYELRCSLVAEGLQQAGHDVWVITSRYGIPDGKSLQEEVNGIRVHRVLGQYYYGPQQPVRWPHFLGMVRPQIHDLSLIHI